MQPRIRRDGAGNKTVNMVYVTRLFRSLLKWIGTIRAIDAVVAFVITAIVIVPYVLFAIIKKSTVPFAYYLDMDRKYLLGVVLLAITFRLPKKPVFTFLSWCVLAVGVSALLFQVASVDFSGGFIDNNALVNIGFIGDIFGFKMLMWSCLYISILLLMAYFVRRINLVVSAIVGTLFLSFAVAAHSKKPAQEDIEKISLQVSSPFESFFHALFPARPYHLLEEKPVQNSDIAKLLGGYPLESMRFCQLEKFQSVILVVGESLTQDLIHEYNPIIPRNEYGAYSNLLAHSFDYQNFLAASYPTVNGMTSLLTGRYYIGGPSDFFTGKFPEFRFTLPKKLHDGGVETILIHTEPKARKWMGALFSDRLKFDEVYWCEDIGKLNGAVSDGSCGDKDLFLAVIRLLELKKNKRVFVTIKNNGTHFPAKPPPDISASCRLGSDLLSSFCTFDESLEMLRKYLDEDMYYSQSAALIVTGDHPFQANDDFASAAGPVNRDPQFGRVPFIIHSLRFSRNRDKGLVTSLVTPYVVCSLLGIDLNARDRDWLGLADDGKMISRKSNDVAVAANDVKYSVYGLSSDSTIRQIDVDDDVANALNKYYTVNKNKYSY